jgi:5-methylcytosine-specific restriction endonuclease McrA
MAISAEYRQYLRSPKWNKLRLETLRLAGYRCQKCGEARPLQAHHLTYDRIFNEAQSDLQALCFPCHEWIHAGLLKRAWIIAKKVWRWITRN